MTARIKGAALLLSIGTPPVDYKCDITSASLTAEDGDTITFCDAENGGASEFKLNLSAIQSTDTASLWRYIWDNSGEVVAYKYAPHGNPTPSASQPHFTGTVRIGPKPTIGGAAGLKTTYTFETVWDCQEEPTMVTTGG